MPTTIKRGKAHYKTNDGIIMILSKLLARMDAYSEAKYGIDRYRKQQSVTTEKQGYVDKFWTDGICTHLPAATTTNESLQLIGGFSLSFHPPTSIHHQRVFMTHWWLFFAVPPTYQQQQPPTSCYNLLVAFHRCSTHLPASTTNKLVASRHRSTHLPASSTTTNESMTRWWLFSSSSPTYLQLPPPTSLYDLLVASRCHSTHQPATSTRSASR